MKNIINFTKTRVLLELEEYKLHGTIPPYFLEGVFKQEFDDSRDALKHWKSELSDTGYATQFEEIEKFIINNEVDNYTDEKEKFDLEFSIVMKRLKTNKAEFKFPTVLYKYRPNINPVRAIYFDVKALEILYDKENKNHRWLLSLFNDKKWYKKLLNAIHTDIISLENLINKNKLRWANMKMLTLPIKIHEAEQMLQDLNTWLYEFEIFNNDN
jgi:hypothetical protein